MSVSSNVFMHVICNIEFVKLCIRRRRNKFENLCPIPLTKYSIKYVQTKPNEKQIDVSQNFVSRQNEIQTLHITFQDLVNTVSSLKYKHRRSLKRILQEKSITMITSRAKMYLSSWEIRTVWYKGLYSSLWKRPLITVTPMFVKLA